MKSVIISLACLIVGILIGMLATCGPKGTVETVVETKTDTIWPDTVFKETVRVVPGPVRTYTVLAQDSLKEPVWHRHRVYADTFRDSSVVITSLDSVNGVLLGKKLSYKLLGPLRIIDSIFTTTTTTTQAPKRARLLVGGGTDLENPNILLSAAYQFPEGKEFVYQYDVAEKSHKIVFLVPLRVGKKEK